MTRIVRKGMRQPMLGASDAKLRSVVEGMLREVEKRGDAAVREFSERLDGWTHERFRLDASEIGSIVASVDARVIDDIRFAQEQIRNFAMKQREAIRDIEVENLPVYPSFRQSCRRSEWIQAELRYCVFVPTGQPFGCYFFDNLCPFSEYAFVVQLVCSPIK